MRPVRATQGAPLVLAWLLAGVVAGLSPCGVANDTRPGPPQSINIEPTPGIIPNARVGFFAVVINGQLASENSLLARAGQDGEMFYLRVADAKALRLSLAAFAEPVEFDGEAYVSLQHIRGLTVRFDEVTQTLLLDVSPVLFEAESLALKPLTRVIPTPSAPGAFLSYDVFSQRTAAVANSSVTNGQFELGVFSALGVVTNSAASTSTSLGRTTTRLDSLLTIDRPDNIATWRIGDSITRTPAWGANARFAGVQYGTNFSTQPNLITFPLNSFTGQTALPSIVDVYVNNVLTGTQRVQAGPFTLNDLPSINGQGELRLVVRDLLGREQLLVKSLYGSTQLLRVGLDDFAIQAGTLRERYGVASAEYGRGFVSGVWRRGLTQTLTAEAGGEAGRGSLAIGTSAAWLSPPIGELSGSLAVSRQTANAWQTPASNAVIAAPRVDPAALDGATLSAAWNRRGTALSIGAQGRWTTPGFRTVSQSGEALPRRQIASYAGLSTGLGSFSLAYTATQQSSGTALELVQSSWSMSFRRWGTLSVNAITRLGGTTNRSISLNYALPFDFLTSVTASTARNVSGGRAINESRISVQRSVPTSTGYGYRVTASDRDFANAMLMGQTESGLYSVEVARLNGLSSGRVSAAGSLTYLDGEVSAGRRIEDAFALVKVPGFSGVRVYLENQELGRTNEAGNLFASRLRPYERNRLSIEQLDLPISADVVSLIIDATPFRKSGVVITFPVIESFGGLARFTDENGTPIPSGAKLALVGGNTEFPIAERGEAYVTGLAERNTVRILWQGKQCSIPISYQRSSDPQPFLGTFICKLEK